MKFKLMKRAVYLFLIMLPLLSFAADSKQAAFEKANAQYTKGQFKEAEAGYKQLVNAGYQSAALYYNLGNAEYRLNDVPSAILYYEKAHKLSPGDEDIKANIRFANQKVSDKIDETPQLFFVTWWHNLILSFAEDSLAIWSVILVILASAALTVYFYTYSVSFKKISFYTAVTMLVLAICTIVVTTSQSSYFAGNKQAIIFNTVNVKGGPMDSSSTLFVLHEGTKVNIQETGKGWLRIRIANGNQGWVKAADAKAI
jgi:tetratricopeptide (TPR) repeat protein